MRIRDRVPSTTAVVGTVLILSTMTTATASERSPWEAISGGLRWLSTHQHEDGHWGARDYQEKCGEGPCSDHGSPTVDVAVTGMALLTFFEAGNTAEKGPYADNVSRGLRWLVKQQGVEVDGLFGDRAGTYFQYGHALATQAVCRGLASGMSHLKKTAESALDFISRSRNPYRVWRYNYPPTGRQEDNDMSVTGMMIHALHLGDSVGLKVDRAALADSVQFIQDMTDSVTWRTGYTHRGGLSAREAGDEVLFPPENVECMTALALWCRQELKPTPEHALAMKGGARLLESKLPRWQEGKIDFMYWYYGSRALRSHSNESWSAWSQAVSKALLSNQDDSGHENGSWPAELDPWGNIGGRVYSTAISTLCLLLTSAY